MARRVPEVDAALEDFDSVGAVRRITALLETLSNWYVRRSRRRFWDGDPAAFTTLYECLDVVTRLMAPFTPFLTDYLGERLFADEDTDSVHLADWPLPDQALIVNLHLDYGVGCLVAACSDRSVVVAGR